MNWARWGASMMRTLTAVAARYMGIIMVASYDELLADEMVMNLHFDSGVRAHIFVCRLHS